MARWVRLTCYALAVVGLGGCKPQKHPERASPDAGAPAMTTLFDPCAARNPVTLVDKKAPQESDEHEAHTSLMLDLAVDAPLCVVLTNIEFIHDEDGGSDHHAGAHQGDREGNLGKGEEGILLGDVRIDGKDLPAGGDESPHPDGHRQPEPARWRLQFNAGVHRIEFEHGRLQVLVPGPVIDAFDPVFAESGTAMSIKGEGFFSPATVSCGALPFVGTSAESMSTLRASVPKGLYIGPVEVSTPFGTAKSSGPFVPASPASVIPVYSRHAESDPQGDGHVDIRSVAVLDDGKFAAVVVDFAESIPSTANLHFNIQSPIPGSAIQTFIVPMTEPSSTVQGAFATHGESTAALVLPMTAVGAFDHEALGVFLLSVEAKLPNAASDRWPDTGFRQVRSIVAPRYLRYRATNPKTVAARHGGTYVITAEGTDISLMVIAATKTLDEALVEMIKDPDAIGAFPEPVITANYAPTIVSDLLDGGSNCELHNVTRNFDTGATADVLPQLHLKSMDARAAWSNISAGSPRGEGVTIIVADTGVNAHEDLPPARVDFARARNILLPLTADSHPSNDPEGHGTNVAGVIGAQDGNGGIVGVAPEATIIPFRVMYRTGATTGFSAARALVVAMEMKARDPAIKIINMSFAEAELWLDVGASILLAFGKLDPAWLAAASLVWHWEVELGKEAASQLTIVASSGNSRETPYEFYGSTYPATIPGAISVGALDTGGTAMSYTTRDPTVALAAPGNLILTTSRRSSTSVECTGGTSISAPLVAGAAAVLYSIPGLSLTPADVRRILRATAIPTGDPADLVGTGRLNLSQAVTAAVAESRRCTAHVSTGGTTHGSPLLDTAFVGQVGYVLMPDSFAPVTEPATGGDYVVPFYMPNGLGPFDWLLGASARPNDDTLVAGRIGASVVTVFEFRGSHVSYGLLSLPQPVTAKPIILRGPPPTNAIRTLVPVADGVVAIGLHGTSYTVTSVISGAGNVVRLAGGNLPLSGSEFRLVLQLALPSSNGVLAFWRYDVDSNNAVHDQDTSVLPFSPISLAVTRARLGDFEPGAEDKIEFQVYATNGTLLLTTNRANKSTTAPVAVNTPNGAPIYAGLLANPARAELIAYTADGVIDFFEPGKVARTFRLIDGTRGTLLGNASMSDDGTKMAFSNSHGYFNANKPTITWYFSTLVFGL